MSTFLNENYFKKQNIKDWLASLNTGDKLILEITTCEGRTGYKTLLLDRQLKTCLVFKDHQNNEYKFKHTGGKIFASNTYSRCDYNLYPHDNNLIKAIHSNRQNRDLIKEISEKLLKQATSPIETLHEDFNNKMYDLLSQLKELTNSDKKLKKSKRLTP